MYVIYIHMYMSGCMCVCTFVSELLCVCECVCVSSRTFVVLGLSYAIYYERELSVVRVSMCVYAESFATLFFEDKTRRN